MFKPTFRQLQVFSVVAKRGNFTQAAKELYLSQPAVSIQVKQLEAQVGLKLFQHVSRKLDLTQAGHVLLDSATKIKNDLNEAEQKIEDLKGLRTGHLELAVVSAANSFSSKLLAKFLKDYPQVTFSLNVSNRNNLIELLSQGHLELAIMGLPPERLNVQAKAIMENPLVIVANAEHPFVGAKNLELQDLKNETFVTREFGSGTRHVLAEIFKNNSLDFAPKLEFSSAEAVKSAVEAGLGLAMVSLHTIANEINNKTLKVLDVVGTPIIRNWHLVSPRGRTMSPIAAKFHDFILANGKKLK